MINTIGLFDIFKQPVKFTMSKNRGSKFENGSIGGFILTVTLLVMTICYFQIQYGKMNSYLYDSYKSEKLTNNMQEWAEF